MTLRCLAAALGVVGLAGPAVAQEAAAGATPRARQQSLLEVGGQIGVIGVYPGTAVLLVGGPRVTVNLTPRDALETIAEAAALVEDRGLHGLYGVQYKRGFGARAAGRETWFATAGVLGGFGFHRQPEWRQQRPDGSTVVWPGYSTFRVSSPAIGTLGVSLERQMRRHLAVRADLQGFAGSGGIGVRVGAGLSIPLGGDRAARP